ncbi:MAG: hypothetical protein IKT27_01615 [Clostridia bacterium]|nr:hypothetical protein [Clostridia bacterium]
MAKALAKRNLIFFAIIAVILSVLCFINFTIPATDYRFTGFANAIVKDVDISGSLTSAYTVKYVSETIDKEAELNKAVNMLNNKLDEFGYGTTRISVGNDEIYVEVPDIKEGASILEAIATEGQLSIRGSETAGENDITGDEVTNISSSFSQIDYGTYKWGVTLDFNKDGKKKLATITESGNGTLYIYVGETQISAISYSNQIKQDYMFFYGDYGSGDVTNLVVLQLLIGKYDVNFDMGNNQIIENAPVLSNNIGTWLIVLFAVIAVLFMVGMFALYGEFGWIINLSYVFFAVFVMFFMQAIPIFVLSMGGVVGTVLGIMLLFLSYMFIFDGVKKGYADGKKIPLATKWGFNNAVMKIVDMNVIAVIGCVVMYILGGAFAQSFALALGICCALNLLISLLLTRWFSKWYVAINSTNPDKLHLKREVQIDENN